MIVTEHNTALSMGSGDLEVFATPSMVALMESVAMEHSSSLCLETQTTVGTHICIDHTRATAVGESVRAEAILIKQEDRKLIYEVKAYDSKGEIGAGVHHRYIVDRAKFLSKL